MPVRSAGNRLADMGFEKHALCALHALVVWRLWDLAMRGAAVSCLFDFQFRRFAMVKIIPLLLICLFAFGCAHKTKNPPPEPVDFVAMTLGQAAEEAHGDLAMLARLRGQGLQPLLPPADPALAERISISWTGPADEAIKQVCLKTGYRYREMGTPSAQELSVVVHGLDSPAHELLEDIAWQIQPQAVLRVDPMNRTVTLARTQGANS